MSNSEQVSKFRQRRKINLIKVFGSKCSICGYNSCFAALEFHHLDEKEKEYSISRNCHSLKDDLKETKKCLLVCSNCHREIHHSDKYTNIDLIKFQVYDNIYAEKLLSELEKIQPKELKCSECGTTITKYSKSGKCSKCSGTRLILNRPDREELKNLIRKLSFVEIGRTYDCTDNCIRKWCDAQKLPRKKCDINKYTDIQLEEV